LILKYIFQTFRRNLLTILFHRHHRLTMISSIFRLAIENDVLQISKIVVVQEKNEIVLVFLVYKENFLFICWFIRIIVVSMRFFANATWTRWCFLNSLHFWFYDFFFKEFESVYVLKRIIDDCEKLFNKLFHFFCEYCWFVIALIFDSVVILLFEFLTIIETRFFRFYDVEFSSRFDFINKIMYFTNNDLAHSNSTFKFFQDIFVFFHWNDES
jgi:hypothetical protein